MKITKNHLLGYGADPISKLTPVGPLDTSTTIDVVLALPARDVEARTALLRDLYHPASPRFRKFLTPEDYTQRFDPTEANYKSLLEFAKANQLTVAVEGPPKYVHVRAPAATINKVFHVTLQQYTHPTEDRHFYAPDTDPHLDVDFPELQITGLDNFTVPKRAPNPAKLQSKTPAPQPRPFGSGINGLYTGGDFRAAYAPGVTLTGQGQVVGTLQLHGYQESDIQAYAQQNGMANVPIQNVYLDGFKGSDSSQETAGDLEMIISMAPGISKLVVYGVNYTNAGVHDALHEMANPKHDEPLPLQISSSWSIFYDQNVYDALARLVTQGQTYFTYSGDDGSYDETNDTGAFPPADHPYATTVGGTDLVTSGPGGAWVSETTWPGSGGGYSAWKLDPQFRIPWWQADMDYTACKGSSAFRNCPDVAMVSDNIAIFLDGAWTGFGGTSASTPLWAGFMALANEQASVSGRPPIGFASPALWAIGRSGNYTNCFHDITTGNNFSKQNADLYEAVVGYDLCTGWGTPKGQSLIDALVRIGQVEQHNDSSSWISSDARGQLNLFARGSDNNVWQLWQTAVNNGWSNWYSQGTPKGASLDGSPILGRNADGRLQLFINARDGTMWSIFETTPGGTWGAWTSLGKPSSVTLTDSAVVASNADGRLEVFAQAADQALWHIWQETPNGKWSTWTSQGKPNSGGIQGSLALAASLDGRLELFAIGNDGNLWHIWQTAVNNGWSNWFSHGTPPGQTFSGSTLGLVVAAQADGRLQLFIPSLSGDLWRLSQTAVNNGWSDWILHAEQISPTNPGAIASNADGRLQLYWPANGGVFQMSQTAPNGAWSQWVNQLPTNQVPVTDGSPALAPSFDGRLELFVVGADGALWHVWQTAVNNGWTAPFSHGTPPKVKLQPNR
jgi:Pro-kumamolisin, activation domain